MSAEFGAKHVYTVIALSSAGMPSMPSLPAVANKELSEEGANVI
jgi:hypothetical protein